MSEERDKQYKSEKEDRSLKEMYKWHAVSRQYRGMQGPESGVVSGQKSETEAVVVAGAEEEKSEPAAEKAEAVAVNEDNQVHAVIPKEEKKAELHPVTEVRQMPNHEKESYKEGVFEGKSFRGLNLSGADFSGASLKGADFSGADLSGVNFSGADLSGADLSGAILHQTNFDKALMNGIRLSNADMDGAVLTDIRIDELGITELQELVEYLAKYFPHKLNLARMNLQLLDFKRIDLQRLDLRGADFTGVDFTGVNIIGLNLSECIITPEQIAQAMGRVPSREELMQMLMPRQKEGKKGWQGIDWEEFFFNGHMEIGVWDATKSKGVSIEEILKAGKKVFNKVAGKPKIKDEQVLERVKSEQKQKTDERSEEVRKNIEKNKQAVREAQQKEKESKEQEKEAQTHEQHKVREVDLSLMRGGRGGMEM